MPIVCCVTPETLYWARYPLTALFLRTDREWEADPLDLAAACRAQITYAEIAHDRADKHGVPLPWEGER